MSAVQERSDDIISRINRLTADLNELRNEYRARMPGATQGTNAAIRIKDLASADRAVMGDLDSDGLHYGFKTLLANGTELFRTDDRGIISPSIMIQTNQQLGLDPGTGGTGVNITAATFTGGYAGLIPTLLHQGAQANIPWATGAGTTGELRIHVTYTPAGVSDSPVLTLPAASSGVAILKWLHGVPLPGVSVQFNVEARRTGGANNVYIYFPTGGMALVGPAGMSSGSPWS